MNSQTVLHSTRKVLNGIVESIKNAENLDVIVFLTYLYTFSLIKCGLQDKKLLEELDKIKEAVETVIISKEEELAEMFWYDNPYIGKEARSEILNWLKSVESKLKNKERLAQFS